MGISTLSETARETRDNQRRAELLRELRELEGDRESENRPTEFEKGVRTIISPMHKPQDMHDKQIHTNIPKQLLTNLMMMDGIEEGMRKLISCDDLEVKGELVRLYRKINQKEDISKTNRFLYKEMKFKAYRRALFYAEAMQGFSGNLLELLMSVDGWRSEQAVAEVGSLANTEQNKINANANENILKRTIKGLIGK